VGLIADLGSGAAAVDTAVFVYFIEEEPRFLPHILPLFVGMNTDAPSYPGYHLSHTTVAPSSRSRIERARVAGRSQPSTGRAQSRPQIRDCMADASTASSAGVGGHTSVKRPARRNSANLRASRRSVLIRSPGYRGTSAGAMT